MKKILMILAVGIVVAAVAAPNGYFLANSDGTIDVVATDAVLSGGVTASGNIACVDLVASDDVSVLDDITVAGFIVAAGKLQNVTNGEAVTVVASFHELNGIGGANDTTNTVSLAAPTVGGRLLTLSVASASTNLITIADSGTAVLAGAWLGDGGDSISLISDYSLKWVETSRSDN